jgi:hypothetical protein
MIWGVIGILCIFPVLKQVNLSGQRLQWMPVPEWRDIVQGISHPYLWGGSFPLNTLFFVLWGIGILGMAMYGLFLSRKKEGTFGFFFLFIYFIFLFLTFLISQRILRCYYIQRYPTLALPFLTIACTLGLCHVKPRAIGAVLLCLVWGINIYSIRANCPHPERPRMEPLVDMVRKNYPDIRFILYDSPKDRDFHKRYFPDMKFYSMDSVHEGLVGIRDFSIIYICDSTIWPENPDLNIFNPLLIKRCSDRMRHLIVVDPYYLYIIERLDILRVQSEWKNRIYLGRIETLGRDWIGFIGAEESLLNDDRSFKLFQFNQESGISFRWTQREDAAYGFRFDPPLNSGSKNMHICFTVDPALFPQPVGMRFEIRADGQLIEQGTLDAAGIRKEYIIPFHIPSHADTINLKTFFPTRPAPSLVSRYGDVPIVGYLFFWAGITENKK